MEFVFRTAFIHICAYTLKIQYLSGSICLCDIKVLVWTVCDSYLGKQHLFLSLKELFWHMNYGGKCCEIVYLFEPKKKDTKNMLHNLLPGISHQTHSRELILQWSKWITRVYLKCKTYSYIFLNCNCFTIESEMGY